MKKTIEIVSYDPNWPSLFQEEAVCLKEALGDNCLDIHHIGSTAVSDLAAKPIIDIMPVVRDITLVDSCTLPMEALGYKAMGEHGIPFRRYFQKGAHLRTHNVHVYEQNNSEIERHLNFRNWMQSSPEDRERYVDLKKSLAARFPEDIFSYCLGKENFIAEIEEKTGWEGFRFVKALTPFEWEAVKNFRSQYFVLCKRDDPDTKTLTQKRHAHLVLYRGTKIVGYVHIQFLQNHEAALRMIVVDEKNHNQHIDRELLILSEKWLCSMRIHVEYDDTRP